MSGAQKLGFCRISRMEESPTLTAFVERMIYITDVFIDHILRRQFDGEFRFHISALDKAVDGEPADERIFIDMLSERDEVAEVSMDNGQVYVRLAPEFASMEDRTQYRELSQEEVDIICANHVLWLHGNGGKQADFSDCILQEINLSSLCLDYAVFNRARFIDCKLCETRLAHASFEMAHLYDCQAIHMEAPDANFRIALFQNTDFDYSDFTNCNFSGSLFGFCTAVQSRMDGCCFSDAFLCDLHAYHASMKGCTNDEPTWVLEHPNNGPGNIE